MREQDDKTEMSWLREIAVIRRHQTVRNDDIRQALDI